MGEIEIHADPELAAHDLNVLIIKGRIAAPPEVVERDGQEVVRFLVTTRTNVPRRRVDVLPVFLYDPDDDALSALAHNSQVWVTASVQRRFWEAREGRRSELRLVAQNVIGVGDKDAKLATDFIDMTETQMAKVWGTA